MTPSSDSKSTLAFTRMSRAFVGAVVGALIGAIATVAHVGPEGLFWEYAIAKVPSVTGVGACVFVIGGSLIGGIVGTYCHKNK